MGRGDFDPAECARGCASNRPILARQRAQRGDDTKGAGPRASEGERETTSWGMVVCPRGGGTDRRWSDDGSSLVARF
jgi:hypothetical protein